MSHFKWAIATIVLLSGTTQSIAGNLVGNGDFETGTRSPWTSTAGGGVINNPVNVYDGKFSYSVYTGSTNQALVTTAGSSYTLTFFYATRESQGAHDSLTVTFGGATVFSDINDFDNGSLKNGYKTFSTTVTAANNSTLLSFNTVQDQSYWLFDDISVTPLTTVPEPSSFALLGLGVIGCSVAAYRRRQRAA